MKSTLAVARRGDTVIRPEEFSANGFKFKVIPTEDSFTAELHALTEHGWMMVGEVQYETDYDPIAAVQYRFLGWSHRLIGRKKDAAFHSSYREAIDHLVRHNPYPK